MKLIQRVIYCGFATVAIASASMPVFPVARPAPSADALSGSDLRERDASVQPVHARTVARDGTSHPAGRIERR